MNHVVSKGRDRATNNEQLWFKCPGCLNWHRIPVSPYNSTVVPGTWRWNDKTDTPTVEPSVLCQPPRCHFFLRDGIVEFLADCEHDKAGTKVPLPPCLSDDNPETRNAQDYA